MYIFIDESGTHKKDGQSTTALVYIKIEDLDNMDRQILQAEKDLKIEPFHWGKQIWKLRLAFLEAIIKQKFEVKIFMLDNPFTQQKMENALTYILTEKNITKIIIDGEKPRRGINRLKKVLRDNGISVNKIRMGNDKAFPCLRLADLFAGLVRAYFQDRNNEFAKRLYKLAEIKITTLAGGQTAG